MGHIELGTVAFVVLLGIIAANPGIDIPTWVVIFVFVALAINVGILTYDIMWYMDNKNKFVC